MTTWKTMRVSDVAARTSNALATGPFGSSIGSRFFRTTGVPVIRGGNLSVDSTVRINDENLVFLSPEKAAEFSRSIVRRGDLVFTSWGTINQVGLLDDSASFDEYVISNKQMKLTPDPKIALPEFLYYLFSGSAMQKQILEGSIGTGVPGFNLTRLRSIEIQLPPIEEQRKIAHALSDAESVERTLSELIVKKQAIKQGMMQQLLTGRARLRGFVNGWEVHALQEDITLISGQHVLAQYCNTQGYGVPYLTGPTDFPDGRIRQTKFTNRPTSMCRTNDILVTVKGSGAGTMVQADASYCISRQLMAVRTTAWDSRFLFYSLLTNATGIRDAATGLIPGLSRSDILALKLPVPSIDEQRAIADALSDVDCELNAVRVRLDKARAIKQGMMQQILTGRTRLPLQETAA